MNQMIKRLNEKGDVVNVFSADKINYLGQGVVVAESKENKRSYCFVNVPLIIEEEMNVRDN
jgi:hypothetical protein